MTTPNSERALARGEVQLPPLRLKVNRLSPKEPADGLVDIAWEGKSCRFVVECKNDSKPQTMVLAVAQAKRYAKGRGEPMIIVPYLTGPKIDDLLAQGVSGIDLCGNGGVVAPGKFSVYRTGEPNRFREAAPLKSAYRGDSSLIARAFVLAPAFTAVSDILKLIESRGGSLVISTVSKALKRLEQDLIIERPERGAARLIDRERLLRQLLDNYEPPASRATWLGRVELDERMLRERLQRAGDNDVVKTGMSSASDYTAFAGEPMAECYTRQPIAKLLKAMKAKAIETRSFPNLRLIETDDQRVYFDARLDLMASPLQCWLEMATGDTRSRETAEQLKDRLIREGGMLAR